MTDQGVVPRIVIADDHSGILDQAAALLRQDFEIVATARDGMFALDCIRRLDPDMALLDLYMPGMNGLDVVRTLQESGTRTVTVILSGYNDRDLAKAAITLGPEPLLQSPVSHRICSPQCVEQCRDMYSCPPFRRRSVPDRWKRRPCHLAG